MFEEYKWIPGLSNRIWRQSLLTGSTFFITAAAIYAWARFGEAEMFFFHGPRIFLFCLFLIAGGIFTAMGTYQSVKKFRMISTDEGIQIARGTREIKISYADITKVQRLKEGGLIIFTDASGTIPTLTVSSEISNIDRLEHILQQYVPIQRVTKIPRSIDFRFRLLTTLWFLLPLGLNVASFHPMMILISGITFIAFATYALSLSWIFRTQVRSPVYLVILIGLSALMIYRMAMALSI